MDTSSSPLAAGSGSRLSAVLHAATISTSAFLLFLVQPIIARQILPWFGGTAAVWTTCMIFFQLALLGGYAYSDLALRRLSARRLFQLHTVLLLVSLAWLPITARLSLQPEDASSPVAGILLVLAATIGLPYFLLSTTGPLIQAWSARGGGGVKVYRLYALSNLASMLALIAYPPLIEPTFGLRSQAILWSAGYVLFVALALASAWTSRRLMIAASPNKLEAGPDQNAPEPKASQQLLWLVLAALGSVVLLAVTSHLTQNVAPIPFLWVLPLALYLLSFILCFDDPRWYWRRVYLVLAAAVAPVMLAGLDFSLSAQGFTRTALPIEFALPLYAIGLFIVCMFLHGELARQKPATQWLTRFYLMVSLGGALGGMFVGLAAPLIFSSYWEIPLALTAVTIAVYLLANSQLRWFGIAALAVSAVLLTHHVKYTLAGVVHASRSFYGTLRVLDSETNSDKRAHRALLHGSILHGEQFGSDGFRRLPTTYYGTSSGVGQAMAALTAKSDRRIGLVGLGVGTLLAYGRAGDLFRIYELDPEVLALAGSHFTFLGDSPARIESRLGDARLSLQREASQQFDLLVVDAFSSDAIPIHLLSVEAMHLYRRHLSPGGTIALHATNQYVDLVPELIRIASVTGLHTKVIVDNPTDTTLAKSSLWVLLFEQNIKSVESRLDTKEAALNKVQNAPPSSGLKPWTDDYSNLFRALKPPGQRTRAGSDLP